MISHDQKEAIRARRTLVGFAKLFPVIMGLIGLFFHLRGHGIAAFAFWGIAAAGLFTALALPRVFERFFRLWMRFGEGMAWLITNLILALIYYLMFLPIGLVLRLLGKDILDEGFDSGAETGWNEMTMTEWEKQQYEKPVGRLALFVQFAAFMRERRKFWLVPLAMALILVGFLLLLSQGSALAPFIYALF